MAVYDRWHREPEPGDQPCKCGRGRGGKLYPGVHHMQGKRWQVRWRDPATGRQRKRNFELRDGANRNIHADAFDKHIQGTIVARTYTDPRAGEISFQSYAETWRAARTHGEVSAGLMEGRFRNHVYPGAPGSERTPKGGTAIGQHPMAVLAQRPSLVAAWVASLSGPLPAPGSRRLVIGDVSAVFDAALGDGIIVRNPLKSPVDLMPARDSRRAQPYTLAEIEAVAAKLPERFAILAHLGAGSGMREMELAALGTGDIQFLGKRPHIRVERQLRAAGGQLVFAPLKNRKPHDVPLSPELARRLARHLEQFPGREVTLPWHDPRRPREHGRPHTVRLVLARDGGVPMSRWAVQSAWRGAAPAGWNLHRLRHTYASAQLRAGVDIVRVAAAMGDTVDVVVKTYAHLLRDEDGDAALRDAVDAFLAPCAPDVPSEQASGALAQADGG